MRTRSLRSLAGLLLSVWVASAAQAATPLYAFGPDADGVGRVLTPLAPAGPGVTLGDGQSAFNGGLTYLAATQRVYAIENDAFGTSSLVSFAPAQPTALATPLVLGSGYYGGLAADGAHAALYAIASDTLGTSMLYAVDPTHGATALATLGSGYYGGLTYDRADGDLYALGGDDLGVQRRVVRIDLDGPSGPTATALFDLGDGSLGFQGGLAYDASAHRFLTIGNDSQGLSALYAFTLDGAGSLEDLATPLGNGYVNAGLAFLPTLGATVPAVPEPSNALLLAAAAPVLWLALRRRAVRTDPSPRRHEPLRGVLA